MLISKLWYLNCHPSRVLINTSLCYLSISSSTTDLPRGHTGAVQIRYTGGLFEYNFIYILFQCPNLLFFLLSKNMQIYHRFYPTILSSFLCGFHRIYSSTHVDSQIYTNFKSVCQNKIIILLRKLYSHMIRGKRFLI